jgi:uncharacterized protein YbjT (DUF2867 family)
MEKVLVLGGTGLLGAPAVERLMADGFDVRLLARDPEAARQRFGSVDVVGGDVTEVTSLQRAMTGCDAVHVSVGGAVDRSSAENVASLAPSAGVGRIIYISGSTVDQRNSRFPMVAAKLGAEEAVRRSGVPYTIFRPTWPMEQIPRFIQGRTALVIGDRLPALHWFAASDLARMISAALRTDEAVDSTLYVHGPEAWTMVEAVEVYRAALRPDIESVTVLPVAAARAQAEASGNQMLGFMADMMAYFDEAGELGDPAEANRILGGPTTTIAQWLASRDAGTRARATVRLDASTPTGSRVSDET